MKQNPFRFIIIFFSLAVIVLAAGMTAYWYQIYPLLKFHAAPAARGWTLTLGSLVFVTMGGLLFSILRFYRTNRRRLQDAVYVDSLTGADNSNAMSSKFKERLQALDGKAALVVLDIVRFKVINDLHGYERGNEVLKQVTSVLQNSLSTKESFCRLSADNFVLLLSFEGRLRFVQRMTKLATQLRRSCSAGSSCILVDTAMGIYEITDPDVPFYIMLDRAHFALEKAKELSLNKYQFFEEADRSRIVAEKQLENTMETALANREFEVYLQPKCDLLTGQLYGAEALVRWNKKDGIVRPDEFIPLFEKNGFILQLDMFIFEEVVRALKEWQERGWNPVPVAVNFSRLHLNDDRFVPQMRRILSKYGVSAHLLEVEITESVIFHNLQRAQAVLTNLHSYGFSVAMDDFGSGYSSLNVLKNLHFDGIKLDKEFLSGFEDNPYAQHVIEGTVKMIKKLNVQVIAEGVETREQADFLKKIGCDVAQGYLFSRPLKKEMFERLLPEQARQNLPV